jgi:organic hydroperoxide reductase OsmC/OhrA
MSKVHFYEVQVNWKENRNGLLSSIALDEKLTIATPPEFPKGEANIWSPEHYYLAAINGCLLTTFLAIAENFKLNFVDFQSTSIGKLEVVDRKYIISEVVLKPIITIANIEDKELAQKVIDKAEKACLITNSIKSKITMETIIKV